MTAEEDGYVECEECGHAIEQHSRTGCTALGWRWQVPECKCPTRWTVKEIQAVRRANGLPGRYDLSRFGG